MERELIELARHDSVRHTLKDHYVEGKIGLKEMAPILSILLKNKDSYDGYIPTKDQVELAIQEYLENKR